MALFTPEELAALREIDEEIEEDFHLTNEDLHRSRQMDREAQLEAMPPDKRKLAAQNKAYREANRERYNQHIKEYMRRYRQRKKLAAI